jgi:hypothetical protein
LPGPLENQLNPQRQSNAPKSNKAQIIIGQDPFAYSTVNTSP